MFTIFYLFILYIFDRPALSARAGWKERKEGIDYKIQLARAWTLEMESVCIV